MDQKELWSNYQKHNCQDSATKLYDSIKPMALKYLRKRLNQVGMRVNELYFDAMLNDVIWGALRRWRSKESALTTCIPWAVLHTVTAFIRREASALTIPQGAPSPIVMNYDHEDATDHDFPDTEQLPWVRILTSKERDVLYRMTILGESAPSIAPDYGVTRQQISNIKFRAIRKCRRRWQHLDPDDYNAEGLKPRTVYK